MTTTTGLVIPPEAWRTYDGLFDRATRLPGWVILLDRTAVALTRAARNGTQVLVAVLHDPRDYRGARADIVETATVVSAQLRRDDTIARVDEKTLIVVCNDLDADVDAAQVARRLVSLARVQCDLGIALSGGHDDPRSLLAVVLRDAQAQRLTG